MEMIPLSPSCSPRECTSCELLQNVFPLHVTVLMSSQTLNVGPFSAGGPEFVDSLSYRHRYDDVPQSLFANCWV